MKQILFIPLFIVTLGLMGNLSKSQNFKFDYLLGVINFKQEKYLIASEYFKRYLENNPNHRLAPKAQFLRAEGLRLSKEYLDAAEQYLFGYDKFNQSEFTSINSMRLGEMMVQLEESQMGCKIFNNIINEYPFVKTNIYKETEKLMIIHKCEKIEKNYDEIMFS